MRLLIVNPNTSAAANERIRAIAEPLVSASDEIEVVSAASGIELIETVEDSTTTVPAVLAMVEAQHHEFDAIIIAAFSDPGLAEARRIASCPVFGISEAAMKVAALTADRFAIITVGTTLGEAIQRNAEAYGFAEQLTGIRMLPWTVAQVSADPSAHHKAFAEACERGAYPFTDRCAPLADLPEVIKLISSTSTDSLSASMIASQPRLTFTTSAPNSSDHLISPRIVKPIAL